jgi:hypothetical protein
VDVERGFEIEHPSAFVPWGCSEQELEDILPRSPRRITAGYHTLDCTALTGMLVTAGFHFEPRRDGVLQRVELFRGETLDLGTSFTRFQHHLELTFGAAHEVVGPTERFPGHEWRFGDVSIRHWVTRRFSEEEHIVLARR